MTRARRSGLTGRVGSGARKRRSEPAGAATPGEMQRPTRCAARHGATQRARGAAAGSRSSRPALRSAAQQRASRTAQQRVTLRQCSAALHARRAITSQERSSREWTHRTGRTNGGHRTLGARDAPGCRAARERWKLARRERREVQRYALLARQARDTTATAAAAERALHALAPRGSSAAVAALRHGCVHASAPVRSRVRLRESQPWGRRVAAWAAQTGADVAPRSRHACASGHECPLPALARAPRRMPRGAAPPRRQNGAAAAQRARRSECGAAMTRSSSIGVGPTEDVLKDCAVGGRERAEPPDRTAAEAQRAAAAARAGQPCTPTHVSGCAARGRHAPGSVGQRNASCAVAAHSRGGSCSCGRRQRQLRTAQGTLRAARLWERG